MKQQQDEQNIGESKTDGNFFLLERIRRLIYSACYSLFHKFRFRKRTKEELVKAEERKVNGVLDEANANGLGCC
jgi:hypothetical protein